MNPLDLRGPEFLLFFFVLSSIVVGVLAFIRWVIEPKATGSVDLSDPYAIARLRGGRREAVSVAAHNLVDRRLLEMSADDKIETSRDVGADSVRRPLEKALVQYFLTRGSLGGALRSLNVEDALAALEEPLARQGLIADERVQRRRLALSVVGIGVLAGTAAMKILVALSRGHSNVLFLLVAGAASIPAVWVTLHPRRTPAGDAALRDVRNLYRGLKDRSFQLAPGGATSEAALLAGVFGLASLPSQFLHARRLKAKTSSAGESTASGGSSCSSCGSSSGSSCGGGGCGGGCGGCGS